MFYRIRTIAAAALHWVRRKVGRDTGAPETPLIEGAVDYAARLTDHMLIATGWMRIEPGASLTAQASIDGQALPLKVSYLSYARPDIPTVHGGKVLTIHPFSAELLRRPEGRLALSAGRGTLTIEFARLAKVLTDLPTALASGLGWLDMKNRDRIVDFVASALKEGSENADSLQLNKSLLTVRDALKAKLNVESRFPALQIDALLAVDEGCYYVRGWMRDPRSSITGLTLISPEGQRVELYGKLFRHRRSDVEAVHGHSLDSRPLGFVACLETHGGNSPSSGWKAEMQNTAGQATQVQCPAVIENLAAIRKTVLQDLALEPPQSEVLVRDYAFPVISRLQERHNKVTAADAVYDYGKPKKSPEVSIIIPLYRRIDFIEHQMAQFYHDPEVRDHDIIYLLDSPDMAQDLAGFASQIFRLYTIPFRVVVLNQNAGFSGVNNVGGSLAHGRLLLLLNSDVLPDTPGWLGKMIAFYDSTPKIGALGAKLLYEDDSLQHAGLYFSRPFGSSVWGNQHYFKGLHRHLPAANVTRQVPAVTAACMMIDRSLYHEMGGLRGIYVQGDYEDSDLCMRLLEAGYENWYLPEVELYHLEGQSYPSSERQMASRYNAWLHTHLWNKQIESVMARYGVSTPLQAKKEAS